jgi:hypothetical protein
MEVLVTFSGNHGEPRFDFGLIAKHASCLSASYRLMRTQKEGTDRLQLLQLVTDARLGAGEEGREEHRTGSSCCSWSLAPDLLPRLRRWWLLQTTFGYPTHRWRVRKLTFGDRRVLPMLIARCTWGEEGMVRRVRRVLPRLIAHCTWGGGGDGKTGKTSLAKVDCSLYLGGRRGW